jgi:hypothetical protein
MIIPLRLSHAFLSWCLALLLPLALAPARVWAQSTCMLVPVDLSLRMQQAPLVVEARVASQQAEQRAGSRHIVTRNQLEVFKLFKGKLPVGGLSVLTTGGTLGQMRETTTSSLQLRAGEQGVFFLEADPASPGEWRAYAGPQGFIRYDLTQVDAADPFSHYPTITANLYPTLTNLAGTNYRAVQPNAPLNAAQKTVLARSARQRVGTLGVTATPVITDFTPTTITAGTSTSTSNPTQVLTINGSGFNSEQGTGYVEFRNADSPGPNTNPTYIQPIATDYVSWTDTQIQVRVPTYSTTGNAAGTGLVRVTNSDAILATSTGTLTVTYALITTAYPTNPDGTATSDTKSYRVHLIGQDGTGGYPLHYSPSFLDAAKTPFETALLSWQCTTSMNRTMGAATTADVDDSDSINVVRFGKPSELPTGVLAVTTSRYGGCEIIASGEINFQVYETDYTFTPVPYPGFTWNYTSSSPAGNQFDFQSVALHELGHGEQLAHIISPSAVMHYSINYGQMKRTLASNIDVVAGNDVINYSTNATEDELCGAPTFTTSPGNCTLPVTLTAFEAVYTLGQGTRLNWTTATELHSAGFVVESQNDATAGTWQAVAQVAAAGTSASTHTYSALDTRLLVGTRHYRLRQVDQDGTVTYSPVRAVQGAELATLAAYPNPATGAVQLRGPLAAGATAQVRVLDATGRCVVQQAGPAGQAAFSLPLAGVPTGLYLVEWLDGPTPYRTRLVVE